MDGDAPAAARPRTRADCIDGPRPCPWVSCTHHALLGRLLLGQGMAPADDDAAVALLEELPVSCLLDVTDAAPDGATFDVVADIFGVTRQRIHYMEKLAAEKAMARARRAGLDGEVTERDLDDVETNRPRRHRTAVRFAEERGPLARPPHLAHLPGFADVAPGADFWCGRIGAAVNTRLCGARRVAVTKASAGTRPIPVYRDCAGCPDGAALADRIAHAPPAPERRRLPVLQPMEPTKMTTETPTCDAKDCKHLRGGVRADSNPALVPFCTRHRALAHDKARSLKVSLDEVATMLREGTLPPPSERHARAAAATNAVKAAKRAKPTRARAPTPAPRVVAAPATPAPKRAESSPVDGVALLRRMGAVITRLGGIDAAEALADELAAMGGAQ